MGSDDGEEDGRVGEGKTAVGGVMYVATRTQPIGRTRLTWTGTQLRAPHCISADLTVKLCIEWHYYSPETASTAKYNCN
jgi:hypothetical protein